MLGDLLKKIGRNTLVYSLGGVLQRVLGFFMIPVYTRYLSPNDYGTIELLDLTSYIVSMFVGLGLGAAVLRFYYDYQAQRDRNEVISTALWFVLPANVVALLLLRFLSAPISRLVFGREGFNHYLDLVFISLALTLVNGVMFSYIRAKQQATLYTALYALQLGLGLSLNLYLIVWRRMEVLGVLYSGVFTQAVMALILFSMTLSQVRFRFSLHKLKAMLWFGGPLIPAGIGMFVLNFADRFFLRKYTTLSVVGTYALGYKLAMVAHTILLVPFNLYWSAHMYEVAKESRARELFAHVLNYLLLGLLFAALGLSLLGQDAVRVLAPPSYWAAAQIVPVIALSYVFSGSYYFFQLGTALTKRTRYRAYAVGASAVFNIVLNFLLIPRYGAIGAAWATLLAFLVLSALSQYFSQKLYPIPYSSGKFAAIILLAAATFGFAQLVRIDSLPLSVAFHLLVLLFFPVLLWIVNLYSQDEKDLLRKAFLVAAQRLGFAEK